MSDESRCPHCGKKVSADALGGVCPECMLKAGIPTQEATEEAGTHLVDPKVPPPTVEAMAEHFPQLEILECLGRGGMGVVYKARQPKLDRIVALKILAPERGTDTRFADRFAREAQALARLNHPHIVTVYDYGESDGLFYLLMEFVDGASLRQLLKTKKMTPEEALSIVPRICEALQYAHEQGVVHRDIKPENVLLDKGGKVKIADFGIAKLISPDRSQPILTDEQVMGTPHYMAPEQVETPAQVDHRADIFSVGVVFYEMLTGELPLGKFQPPCARMKPVRVDVRLDEVVLHALEREPDRRYQHASDVQHDVENLTSGSGTANPAPVSTPSTAGQTALSAVQGPGIGLMIVGIANWVIIPLAILLLVPQLFARENPIGAPIFLFLFLGVIPLVLSTIVILASFKMRQLEWYGLAVIASLLAMVVTPGNLLGLPIGVWSLVVILRPEVRQAFKERRVGASLPPRITSSAASAAGGSDATARGCLFMTGTALIIGVSAVVLFAVGMIILALLIPAWTMSPTPKRVPVIQRMKAQPQKPPLPFGPTHEVLLQDVDSRSGAELLDLDRAQVLDLDEAFAGWDEAYRQGWLREQGVDLAVGQVGQWGLIILDDTATKLVPVESSMWMAMNPSELEQALVRPTSDMQNSRVDKVMVRPIPGGREAPWTFVFETPDRTRGLLQVTQIMRNGSRIPSTARLRFKSLSAGQDSRPEVDSDRGFQLLN